MSDAQKYQKKKNILIILFMFLLVVFVGVICMILIYAKKHPPEKFLSKDDIEIVKMNTMEYDFSNNVNFREVMESNTFRVVENNQELQLMLTPEKNIKIQREGKDEIIKIMQNDKDINNNIKLIYQTEREGLILTDDGSLYKLTDKTVVDNQLKVGQILTNMKVKNIVSFPNKTANTYIMNTENKVINIDTLEEYKGIVNQINTGTSTIYIYENNLFGLEEGKIIVDQYNNPVTIKISFDNKIIGQNDVVYQINPLENILQTSNLGSFYQIGYRSDENGVYEVTLKSSTGYETFTSTYYYQ